MTRFQKIQIILSIIPFYSFFFAIIVTMIELKRHKAKTKDWIQLFLICSLAIFVIYILNTAIMTGQHPTLNIVASGLILAIANVLCVNLQMKCADQVQVTTSHSKTLIIVGLCGVGVIVIISVILVVFILMSSNAIEDINGEENTDLGVILLDDILSTTNDYSARNMYYSHSGSNTNVAGKLDEYDYDVCSFGCKEMSGIMTLMATNTNSNTMMLKIDSLLESGNMEVIIIVDDNYYGHAAINQLSSITLDGIANKTVVVKIAAESAEYSISVSRII